MFDYQIHIQDHITNHNYKFMVTLLNSKFNIHQNCSFTFHYISSYNDYRKLYYRFHIQDYIFLNNHNLMVHIFDIYPHILILYLLCSFHSNFYTYYYQHHILLKLFMDMLLPFNTFLHNPIKLFNTFFHIH